MPKSGHDNNADLRQRIIYPIKNSKSFNYKAKLFGNVDAVADDADNNVRTKLEKNCCTIKKSKSFHV